MGRPSAITDQVREAIEYLYRPGVSVRVLHAELRAAGVDVSHATVHRYLKRRAENGAPPPAAPVRAAPAPAPASSDAPPAPVDEVASLEAEFRDVDAAMTNLRPALATGGAAVLEYKRLGEVKDRLARTLAEIRPRPEAEAERLAALGAAARAELLERVRAAARVDEGLRGKVQRQREVIEALTSRVEEVEA